jgi:acyl carrier protein
VSSAVLPERVRSLLRRELHVVAEHDDEDLVSLGKLDSLGLVELLAAIEREFDVVVELDQLNLDEFRSPATIAGVVSRLRGTQE